jgi:hypothetical protein
MGVLHIVEVYDGVLILSRPVMAWNRVAVMIHVLNVGASLYAVRRDRTHARA